MHLIKFGNMKTPEADIRSKLYDYIRVADEKKLLAIYNLLENEITDTNNWWENQKIVTELDNRYKQMESGKDSGFTLEESQAAIKKYASI